MAYMVTSIKLTDYSTSNYISVMDGEVTIWDEYKYIGHTTHVTSYQIYAEETKIFVELLISSRNCWHIAISNSVLLQFLEATMLYLDA